MIKHIVLFKVKSEFEGEKKQEVINMLKDALEALPAIISEIKGFEVGVNFADSPAAYDISLFSEFESKESLKAYAVHPEHQKVVKLFGENTENRVVVDYEKFNH